MSEPKVYIPNGAKINIGTKPMEEPNVEYNKRKAIFELQRTKKIVGGKEQAHKNHLRKTPLPPEYKGLIPLVSKNKVRVRTKARSPIHAPQLPLPLSRILF